MAVRWATGGIMWFRCIQPHASQLGIFPDQHCTGSYRADWRSHLSAQQASR